MEKPKSILENVIEFSDNSVLQKLVGSHNEYLKTLESQFHVKASLRGNMISLVGHSDQVGEAEAALKSLYDLLGSERRNGSSVSEFAGPLQSEHSRIKIKLKTGDQVVVPRNKTQSVFCEALRSHDLVFGVGPAGTGKTYMAVAMGLSFLMDGLVDRLIVSRPAIEAGEKLGFLPGDLKEKIDPYLRPIFDALRDILTPAGLEKLVSSGTIEIAPLAFMRGRTLARSYVILDEAQNTTPMQMKMLLTRLGEESRMVIVGDVTQVDLPPQQKSGLVDAVDLLHAIENLKIVEFSEKDVVRHPLVGQILRAYHGLLG